MVELGKALNTLKDPPVKALFVYNSNPAAVCPNHNQVVRGLQRPDLFTVVHEQFFTDTVDYADIVLPATTFFEHKDLQGATGTTICRCRTRRLSRWASAGRTSKCFAPWPSAWDLTMTASANPWTR